MNLSETKVFAKKVIFIAFAMTILYYIFTFIYKGGQYVVGLLGGNEIVAPEAKYGKLDRLQMQSITVNSGIQYVLDTQTGGLPQFPDRLMVYKFAEPATSLLSEQQMKKLAGDLGYKQAPTKITNSDFRWVDGTNRRQMDANIVTKNFDSVTEMSKLSSALSIYPSIKDADAVSTVKNFLSSQGLVDKADLDTMQYTTVPTIINFGQFKDTVLFPSNAKLMKVDGFRHLLTQKQEGRDLVTDKDYKILGPNPKNSLISFFVSNSQDVFKLAQINFNYQKVNLDEKSDYPLAPISSVWGAVSQGNGVVSYVKLKAQDYYAQSDNIEIQKINIRDIYIAYYEPSEISSYLQPIYVFEGVFTTVPKAGELSREGDIVIYFPAVSGDFVN